MFKYTAIVAALLMSSLSMADTNLVASNDTDREALSITIYNESLALINETRNIPFKAGLNNVELKGVSAQIRAETALLTSLSNSPFRVIEQNFDYDLLSPDEKMMDLSGLITLNNQSGTTFNNAKLQLIAGDVNQVNNQIKKGPLIKRISTRQVDGVGSRVKEEQFGDYHLYKIPFATDLKSNQTKQVALLSAQKIPVQKEYRFNQNYNYSTQDGQNLKATVFYRIDNKKENQLGMPLPKGVFRMFKNDSSGNALLVGEDSIRHIAENEQFVINTGSAFDVSLVKKVKDQKRIADKVHQYTYEVTFNNAKDEAVDVTYLSNNHYFSGWEVLKTTHPTTEADAKTAKWVVNVPAKEKITLTYTLQLSNQ